MYQLGINGTHIVPVDVHRHDSIVLSVLQSIVSCVMNVRGPLTREQLIVWIRVLQAYPVINDRFSVNIQNPNVELAPLLEHFQPTFLQLPLWWASRVWNIPVTGWWLPSIEGFSRNRRLKHKTIQLSRTIDPQKIYYSRISWPTWDAFQKTIQDELDDVWKAIVKIDAQHAHTLIDILSTGWIVFTPQEFALHFAEHHKMNDD